MKNYIPNLLDNERMDFMTFAQIRKEGQRLYKETAEAVGKKEATLQKIKDMKVYRDNYIQRAGAETEKEIADLWTSAGVAFQLMVNDTITKKREAIEKMLTTPPTVEQVNILSAIQLDGRQPSQEEAEAIARSLADNYRASHALQGILEKVGFRLQLASTCDYAALTDALNQVEGYLKDRGHELKNFPGWRNAHPWFRLFFGEGWSDNIFDPNAELLDGNKQTTPTVELADDPSQAVKPEASLNPDPDGSTHTGPKTIGGVVMLG